MTSIYQSARTCARTDAPMLGSGSLLFLALLAVALFAIMGGAGCAHRAPSGHPSCAELAGVDPMSERVEPVWIRNPGPSKYPAYVLGGVRIVSTNEVIPTLPHQRCGRYVAPPPNGLQIF